MAVVPATNLWIDANFKETQLAHMRIGQPATVISDIYGDDVKYTGKVVGLDMGTGSAFSLLPAQNATGNWIKVVQRLPVRIELDENSWRNIRCASASRRWWKLTPPIAMAKCWQAGAELPGLREQRPRNRSRSGQ